jgi:integrase
VDLDGRRITIRDSTSTKRVPDEIWINQPLFEILSRLKAKRGLQKVVGPYVFQKINGKPYGTIKTTWKTCCRKAGVVDAHIHDIRHKAITDMGKRGYTIQQIAKIAGHSQISTTMRYTHLRAEDTREALESLGRRNESGLVNLGS